MAADVKFRLLSDDSLADSPHLLTPQTLYRGMAVMVEYHELYVKNEGTVLGNPAHSLIQMDSCIMESADSYVNRKITGSTKDGGSTDTVYIAYSTAYGGKGQQWDMTTGLGYPIRFGPTAIPDVDNQMANGRCYDLWTKYLVAGAYTALKPYRWTHRIGGE